MKRIGRNEMKKLSGGAPPPFRTLWRCLIDSSWYENVCYSVNPGLPCGYGAGACTNIGSCTASGDFCIY